jgi:hypothetical protein
MVLVRVVYEVISDAPPLRRNSIFSNQEIQGLNLAPSHPQLISAIITPSRKLPLLFTSLFIQMGFTFIFWLLTALAIIQSTISLSSPFQRSSNAGWQMAYLSSSYKQPVQPGTNEYELILRNQTLNLQTSVVSLTHSVLTC